MTEDQILKDLKNKVYYPVYYLGGEEPYFIDKIADYIETNVLDELEKEFNQQVLYGGETDVESIIAEARRFPMMSNHLVIIVKEAQGLKDIKNLIRYVNNPQPSTILVLCYKYGKVGEKNAFLKSIAKNGVLFEKKKLYENQMPDWVMKEAQHMGFKVSPRVAQLIADYLGNDLTKIAKELDRISVNLDEGNEITMEVVEKNMGLNRSFTFFELNNALGTKSLLKSNQIVNYFAKNDKQYPFVVLITVLSNYFIQLLQYQYLKDKSQKNVATALKIHPFFVRDYVKAAANYSIAEIVRVISLLREYDLRSKGVYNPTYDNGELMREMVYKILHRL